VNSLHIAILSLFIVGNLLLLLVERLTPLPGWLHLAAVIMLAASVPGLWAALRRREERLKAELRCEITGMQQVAAKAARRYKSFLERAANAIFVFNADTVVLEEVNRRGTEIFGYSKEEFSSMLGRDLLHESEHEKFRSLVYRLKRRGRVDAEGLTFQRKDGSLFLGEVDAMLIELVDEQVVHCVVRDITEKVRTEQEVWQRNRELSILNNILTGMNRGPELVGVLEGTLAEILELFQAGGGTIHLLEGGGVPPLLAASERVPPRLLELICAEISGGALELRVAVGEEDPPGSSLRAGAAAEGWGALTAVPLISQKGAVGIMHLVHPARHDYTGEELRFFESVGTQMGNVIEQTRVFAELNWKSAELLRSHHLLEKSSHSLSLSEIKLKQNLALVEQANLELSRLDRMKIQFLGMVSHEFNTPLTSIISGSEHLLREGRGKWDDQVLEMVRDGGLRLKELVADLLKLIRLEARAGGLEPSPLHLRLSLESLKEQLQPQLCERGQSLRLSDLDALPFFDGDWKYLERVFSELLLNAIRFTPDGGEIEVTGRVVDSAALRARRDTLERFNGGFLGRCGDRCYLEVEVRDKGVGIPYEEQGRIFEIFYEVGEIRHHSSGRSGVQGKGAGLGLAIVKGMVEAHGGMVWVESGVGSSFFLVLPLEQEAIQPALF
jgi:PAS domain S-box-containing protein